ncbi:uncharacterized protein BKCO1_6600034 [Diplodia corticola]|uniref:Uncharacterized protein n=1 Tax=Diplodia corticola TaxID=236234 RepID=A0A1J9RCA0_9PEZI|nr:uncharacterized protein BKCO1_6600034 [Diplodia corticola]OJD30099.1 hypothetical protein BKCO1_6600034 [Diplodia corticola]
MLPTHIRIAQLSLAGLSFIFGICIMGTSGHTLAVYNAEYSTNPWWLPLWNGHFDVRGTNTLIGAGAVITILNLAFLILCFLPKLNLTERTTARAFITLGLVFPTLVVAFGCFVYAAVLNKNSPSVETIQTWTCKFKGKRPSDTTISVPTGVSNQEFSRLCAESKFALYTTLVVFLLQGFMLVIAVLGWCVEKWYARKQRKQSKLEDGNSVEMSNGSHHDKEVPVSVHSTAGSITPPPPRY